MARLRDPQRASAVAAALAIVPLVLTRAIVTLSADAPDTLVMAQRMLEAARDLFATRYGMLVALVGAGVLASAGLGRVPWASAGLAAASLAIVASSGHAAAPARGAWAAVGTDWLHLLFASIWLGGLAALVFANVPYGGTRPAAAAFHRVV
jgi:putative copper export protein